MTFSKICFSKKFYCSILKTESLNFIAFSRLFVISWYFCSTFWVASLTSSPKNHFKIFKSSINFQFPGVYFYAPFYIILISRLQYILWSFWKYFKVVFFSLCVYCCQFPSSHKDTSQWTGVHPNPVWPHCDSLAKTLSERGHILKPRVVGLQHIVLGDTIQPALMTWIALWGVLYLDIL